MKYTWCICDMDGTLLNSKDIISEENEAALKKLQQKGTEVIIASGRIDLMVKRYIRQLDLKGYIISCNGGLIRNIETGEILYSNKMDKNVAKEIITYCTANCIDFLLYTTDMVYYNEGNPRAVKYENVNKTLPDDLKIPFEFMNKGTIENLDNFDVLKILLIFEDHEQVNLLQKHYSKYETLTAVSSFTGLLDIMASNSSKGNALKILSEMLNVDLSKAIAFGDNFNDMDMLRCVGLPIAMSNAVEELKAVAKYITKSNNESGVAYAINNFI